MVINALNSGAKVFMADLEDATSPTWHNVVEGQRNLYDAVRRTITFAEPGWPGVPAQRRNRDAPGATPRLAPRRTHMTVDGEAVSGSLFDFGLYFFHNAKELIDRGTGPYFYLPKMESHREARLWNDVFTYAQEALASPAARYGRRC